jgi:L-threonine kinase
MKCTVWSPGSCGEFIQGIIHGREVLVSCPISLFSIARNEPGRLEMKSARAKRMAARSLGRPSAESIQVTSSIPRGKGMGSSTADITSVMALMAASSGRRFSPEELTRMAARIEPSDSTAFPGLTLIDRNTGRVLQYLGRAPSFDLLVFDEGGTVNTVGLSGRMDIRRVRQKKAHLTQRALSLLVEGIRRKDVSLMGKASVLSAKINQSILYKPHFEILLSACERGMAKGVVTAHSGTVMGLMVSPEENARHLLSWVGQHAGKNLRFMGRFHLFQEGIQYVRQ